MDATLIDTEMPRTLAPAPPERAGMDRDGLRETVRFIEAEIASRQFPGAALVVTRRGRTVLARHLGTYCAAHDPAAPYHGDARSILYSFSKGITATVVVMARQQGLLDYDTPVKEYMPDFAGGGKDGVTLRHLLTHSAGIPSAGLLPAFTEEQWNAAVEEICAAEVEWEPGSRTLYHARSGTLIAADVVRRVTGGATWDQLCREWVFEPLGAEALSFGAPREGEPLTITPIPKTDPVPTDVGHYFLGHPAGGCLGTPAEMLLVLNLHLNGGAWNGKTLIEPDAFREMHTVQYEKEIRAARAAGEAPAHEYWGIGWLLRGDADPGWFGLGTKTSRQAFGHAGISTVIGVADPARELALAFVTTDSPKSDADTVRIRNAVTDRVVAAATD